MVRYFLILTASVAGIVASAAAASADDPLTEIRACRALPDAARLACYDAIAAQLKSAAPALTSPAPVTATAQEFGVENLSKANREAAGQPVPLDEIHAAVTAVSLTPHGHFIVILDNGQVWRQIDGDTGRARFNKKGGDGVTISRGLLGSYNLVIDGHAGLFKVARMR